MVEPPLGQLIGVDEGKTVVLRRLRVEEPGPGYCHFPISHDDEYFAQLTAEKRVVRYQKGRPIYEWVAIRPRNEALDIRVLNVAAFSLFAPDEIKLPKPKKSKSTKQAVKKKKSTDNSFAPDDWNFE